MSGFNLFVMIDSLCLADVREELLFLIIINIFIEREATKFYFTEISSKLINLLHSKLNPLC